MPGSGWPRPYKLNGGFIGFLARIALCALVVGVVVCLFVFCLHILFPEFVFLWVGLFLIFALLCICWFLFE